MCRPFRVGLRARKKARVSLGLLTVAPTSQVTLDSFARAKVQPFKLTTKKKTLRELKSRKEKNNMIFLITSLVRYENSYYLCSVKIRKEVFKVTRKEKVIAYQVINLLRMLKAETNKEILKDETERLISELEKSLD